MTRRIILSVDERTALEEIRDTHPSPYMRERAASILKVAGGMSAHAVAKFGLLKERKPDTYMTGSTAGKRKGFQVLW